MNNRDYKEFAPDTISHVYNRGNNKGLVFIDNQDYKAFMFRVGLVLGFEIDEIIVYNLMKTPYSRIRINSKPGLFRLHAFCLMPNHFHLLIEQCGDISISKFILQVCTSYSKYFNKKYKRVGHVFQDKFRAVLTNSNQQLMWSSAYIHMNPVVANLAVTPENYEWSSYKYFSEKKEIPILCKNLIPQIFGNIENFKKQTFSFKQGSVKGRL